MLYRFAIAFIASLFAALSPLAHAKEPPPDAALHAWFEREFERGLRESPELATYLGEEGYNDRLTDLSPAAMARRKARTAAAIIELQRFDPRRLNTQDRLSRELVLADLRLALAFNDLYGPLPFAGNAGWRFIGPTNGPHAEFAELAKVTPMRNARDADDYLRRLAALPVHLEQTTALLRAGMQSGWMPPRATMDRVVGEFDSFASGAADTSPLFAPLKALPDDVPVAEVERLQGAARKLLAERVQPAFAQMQRFLETDYLPACPKALAASALPGGKAYYALTVRDGTTTALTPQAIHDVGLAEVARIQIEMDRLIAQTGFEGTRAGYFDKIRSDPQFYYTRGEDMLRDYRDMAKRVDAELPKLFAELPRQPYGIRAMEAYEGDNAEH